MLSAHICPRQSRRLPFCLNVAMAVAEQRQCPSTPRAAWLRQRALRSAIAWLLYLPALTVLLLYCWAFLDHGWSIVSFPYQIDYGEAPELNRALLLAQGRQIYVDWSQPPYQMANYPPLYPVATGNW